MGLSTLFNPLCYLPNINHGFEEKERYKADIRATNILLQGIPKDIYSLIDHYTDAKDIWENVKMILEGSELTKDDRESQLYDDFEHFRQIKGENIQGYYVRFTKLINDMRNIKMTMSRMQLSSKFVNNMLPAWSRFITEVKLNRGLKESNCDQLYAYLKQHEMHANENRIMMERFGHEVTIPNPVFCCSEFGGCDRLVAATKHSIPRKLDSPTSQATQLPELGLTLTPTTGREHSQEMNNLSAPALISQAHGLSRKRSRSPSSPFFLDTTTFSDGKPASEAPELNPEDVTARLEDLEVEIDTLHADTKDKVLLIAEL
ncbi:hypothetical protein Tco_0277459 [Tanacetum coccineum]